MLLAALSHSYRGTFVCIWVAKIYKILDSARAHETSRLCLLAGSHDLLPCSGSMSNISLGKILVIETLRIIPLNI